ncbi:MAG TPA: AbrB family transcriptional regulator [Burkholderiaceae bacterium]|nr:AbrB family transcriptional regulator [Burkholderiaceae bacterium]
MTRFFAGLVVALIGAWICVNLHTPLPWLIGSLFATATVQMAHRRLGLELRCPVAARNAGQWAIGCALGLYFTPAVVALVARLAPWIALGIAYAFVLGFAMAWGLRKLVAIDRATAVFAMAIGGASEMAVQGERAGARVDRVAAAHSLRVVMVVTLIPFAYKFLGLSGVDPYEAGTRIVSATGLVGLMALTCAGALAWQRLGAPNAWVIGPLLVAIVLTASGHHLSALPMPLINLGQLLIGLSLGSRFTPEFFKAAPRYLSAVAVIVLAAIVVSIGFAVVVARGTGLPLATLVLATSPGGIAEMSLTAKLLQLGVPVVTAFHVTRMTAMVLLIGPMYRLMNRAT